MLKWLTRALVCALFLSPALALAQGSVLQAGPPSGGHAPMYSPGGGFQAVIQDSGPASGGPQGLGLSELLQVNQSSVAGTGTGPLGTHECHYDAPINSGAYHYFCLDANAQGGGLLAYGFAGTAPALPFNFNINGTNYTFPFTVGGVVGPSTSTVGHSACWNNITGSLLSDCGASAGTVTSVAVSGGSTGLTTSGGPVTTSGTITLAGTLAVANGGTGATSGGSVAANNIGALAEASNLSDLASIASARMNLGLGTSATVNTGTSGATIPLLNGNLTFSGNDGFTGSLAVYGTNGIAVTNGIAGGSLVIGGAAAVAGATSVGAATVAADAPQWAQVLGGNGAVYNDVHSSRSFGVSYTNTQGKPILVSVWGTTTGADQLEAETPASTVVALGPYYGSSGITISVQFIVPAGATYKVVTASSATNLVGWQEFY